MKAGLAPPVSSGRTSDHSCNSDQEAGSDEARDQITQPSAKGDAEEGQDKVGDDGADNTEKNVHQHAHVALHEHLGEPAGDAADDDCGDPADTCIFHGISPS